MFNKGDRVTVNFGGNGTQLGTIYETREAGKLIFVQLDSGSTATVDPWDVFHIEEETE